MKFVFHYRFQLKCKPSSGQL